jgi:heterodisulfide reductase subunit A-like polyferredoxin
LNTPIPLPPTTTPLANHDNLGVFICQCGGDISEIINIDHLCEEATHWPGVTHAAVLPFACSHEGAEVIQDAINSHHLNKVVLAGCTCCSIDQVCYSCTYQRVRCKDHFGLFPHDLTQLSPIQNSSLLDDQPAAYEFVNIREQCAWAHADHPLAATNKARILIESTVARLRSYHARSFERLPIERTTLVLGNGVAADTCRMTLQNLGFKTQHIKHLPDRVWRSGLQYKTSYGESILGASTLVLAPEIITEIEHVSGIHADQIEELLPGIFLCDPNFDPIASGHAAAARTSAWVNRMDKHISPNVAFIDPSRCRACSTCVEICEVGAPELIEEDSWRAAHIDPLICIGCGTCAVHCPSGAITAGYSTDEQLEAMLDVILKEQTTG